MTACHMAHLTKVINGAGTAISTGTYNTLGQRVRDVSQTETTDEAYGAGGSLLCYPSITWGTICSADGEDAVRAREEGD